MILTATKNSAPPSAAVAPKAGGNRSTPIWLFTAAVFVVTGLLSAAGYQRWHNGLTTVLIHFNEGHGLRVGADVQLRGVVIGRVTDVRLRPEFAGVDVQIAIFDHAKGIARKDSRFWIARPTLNMTRGPEHLETAVGDKYVAVMPSAAGEPTSEFTGLESTPIPEPSPTAVRYRIVLKQAGFGASFALQPGAPVVFWGKCIGHIKDVNDPLDGEGLHATMYIEENFTKLITENAKFHAMKYFSGTFPGGFALDFSALGGGVELKVPDQPGKRALADHEFLLEPTTSKN